MNHTLLDRLEILVRQNIYTYYWSRKIYFWICLIFRISHEKEFEIIKRIPERQGIILDVGANDGISAVSARVYNKTNPILSLEPNLFHEERLRWLSRWDSNFTFKMIGAGKFKEKKTLYTPVYKKIPITTIATLTYETARYIPENSGVFPQNFDDQFLEVHTSDVDIIPIDELDLNVILVKIDVDCNELLVLEGMPQTLKKCHPVIIVENSPGVMDEIITFLETFGYNAIDSTTMAKLSRESIRAKHLDGGHRNIVFWPDDLVPVNPH
jgi:FkbM family methyltransferase